MICWGKSMGSAQTPRAPKATARPRGRNRAFSWHDRSSVLNETMFTILGADGNEYGPASLSQVRAWMNAGRANLDTQAKLPGETEWRRLGDIPEFNGETSASLPPRLNDTATAASASVPSGHREPEQADRLTRLTAVLVDTVIGVVVAIPGGLILGGAITTTNGAALLVQSGTLDGVTVNGNWDVGSSVNNASLTVTNGLVVNGTLQVGNPT
ncbi:MAG: DUF4339 domain-containing protein, partial [Opitutaceae bacterium]